MKQLLKITNLLSPLLKKYRYRNKADPFKLFKRIRKNELIPTAEKGNVLILPIRVAPVSNLFEGVYGYALKLRGYKVHALLCDQFLNKCDNIIEQSNSTFNCSLCKYEQKRLIDTFSLIGHSYSSLLQQDCISNINKIIKNTEVKNLLDLMYDDVLLGPHIKSAVMRHLLSADVDIEKDKELIIEYTLSTLYSYEATKQLLIQTNPKFVISSHGVYSTWGGALEACKKLEKNVIVWGRGYVDGNIIMSKNESYLYERVYEPTKYWENLTLTASNKDKLNEYFLAKRNPNSSVDHVNYYKGIEKFKVNDIVNSLGLKKDRVKFGLFPNIPWDGTTFSSSTTFPTMELFFEVTINWFIRNQECDLIIRAHPAELKNPGLGTIKEFIHKLFPSLPSNVYFLEADSEFSSYEVADISDACVMYASTMALEFAYFGKTVIQAGQSNVSNKGLIFEVKSTKEYEKLLERVSKKELRMSDEMTKRVQKYAYHWLFKRHIPENTYNHKALTFTNYNLKTSMDLAPGKNKVVDWFIDRCEDGKPFIWEKDA